MNKNIADKQTSRINKLLVVGHADSGLENVSELLHHAGMAEAKASKKEQMLPSEITTTLLKTHKADAKNFKQVEVSPVWNGLALDLLLGNIDQEPWYWADSDALPLLDYWKSLDTQLSFALVYNSPADLIVRAASKKKSLSPSDIDEMFTKWNSYNRALLDFYYNNPQRATLVHAKQIEQNTGVYLQHLENALGLPLKTSEVAPELIKSQALTKIGEQAKSMYGFFAQGMLEEYPEAKELYEELQSVANLHYDEVEAPKVSMKEAFYEALELENDYVVKLNSAQKEQEARTQELETKKAELTELLTKATQTEKAKQEQSEENELLLTQLHTVQEELEKLYLQNKTTTEKLSQELGKFKTEKETLNQTAQKKQQELENEKKKANEQAQKLQQELETKKAELTELLTKATQTEKAKQEQSEENELLLTQLHTVQEELEKLYLQNKTTTEKLSQELGKFKTEKETLNQTAQKKQQELENEKKKANEQAQKLQQELETKKAELENQKVQVGQNQKAKELTEENELLLTQLHTVQEELERYYLENQKLKTSQKPTKQKMYGAAERIKAQLSYKLGAKMIENSRSFGGVIVMPFSLMNVAAEFRKEQKEKTGKKLPPVHTYADAHEAEKIKNHLSYMLGKTMIATFKKPFGTLRMPFALANIHKTYKQKKAKA